jgi:hypothetical protein
MFTRQQLPMESEKPPFLAKPSAQWPGQFFQLRVKRLRQPIMAP